MLRGLYSNLSFALTFLLMTPFIAQAGSGDSLTQQGFRYETRPQPGLDRSSAASEKIYSDGNFFVEAGLNFGIYKYGYGNRWSTITPMIPLTAELEVAALDFIGIGGFFGYASRKYEYTDGRFGYDDTYAYRFTYTSFGAKGVFHVIPFLEHLDVDHNLEATKYDLYITHYLGARVETSGWVDDDVPEDVEDQVDRETNVYPIIMFPTAGARYMFSDFFGAYAEVGYGHMGGGNMEAGLTLRF